MTDADKPTAATAGPPPAGASAGGSLKRWLPLAALLVAMALVPALGLHKALSFKTIGLNYDALRDFIATHTVAALAGFVLAYVAVVALSLPGATIMTLAGGLLFGWKLAAPATVVGATIGATLIFLVARTSLGPALAARGGPALQKIITGFREDAWSYLLFLRLVPVFPFFLVNIAPGLAGVPLGTYVAATFLGIIPGTAAYSIAGSGLGSVVTAQNAVYKACLAQHAADAVPPCVYDIDIRHLVTGELLLAFAALGLVALIPVVLKKWRKTDGA